MSKGPNPFEYQNVMMQPDPSQYRSAAKGALTSNKARLYVDAGGKLVVKFANKETAKYFQEKFAEKGFDFDLDCEGKVDPEYNLLRLGDLIRVAKINTPVEFNSIDQLNSFCSVLDLQSVGGVIKGTNIEFEGGFLEPSYGANYREIDLTQAQAPKKSSKLFSNFFGGSTKTHSGVSVTAKPASQQSGLNPAFSYASGAARNPYASSGAAASMPSYSMPQKQQQPQPQPQPQPQLISPPFRQQQHNVYNPSSAYSTATRRVAQQPVTQTPVQPPAPASYKPRTLPSAPAAPQAWVNHAPASAASRPAAAAVASGEKIVFEWLGDKDRGNLNISFNDRETAKDLQKKYRDMPINFYLNPEGKPTLQIENTRAVNSLGVYVTQDSAGSEQICIKFPDSTNRYDFMKDFGLARENVSVFRGKEDRIYFKTNSLNLSSHKTLETTIARQQQLGASVA